MACNKHDEAQPKIRYQVIDEDRFAEIWATFNTLAEAETEVIKTIDSWGDRRFTIFEMKPLKRFTSKSTIVEEVIEL